MGLESYTPPRGQIALPTGDALSVRGISLQDITHLVQAYGPQLKQLFDERDTKGDPLESFQSLAIKSLHVTPEVAIRVIALAIDSKDLFHDEEKIATLPFPVQLDALNKIGEMTFTAGYTPKKVIETVLRVMNGLTDLLSPSKALTN